MKKKDLVKLLKKYPEDEEVFIWNGFVGDWQDFIIQEISLVKEIYQHKARFDVRQLCMERKSWKIPLSDVRKIYKEHKNISHKDDWDTPNQFVPLEEYPEWYGDQQKEIILLEPKERGKKTFDRLGTINY